MGIKELKETDVIYTFSIFGLHIPIIKNVQAYITDIKIKTLINSAPLKLVLMEQITWLRFKRKIFAHV